MSNYDLINPALARIDAERARTHAEYSKLLADFRTKNYKKIGPHAWNSTASRLDEYVRKISSLDGLYVGMRTAVEILEGEVVLV